MSKLALVTGGTRGIGAAISIALKYQGYKVVANYRTNKKLGDEFEADHSIATMSWDVSNFTECHEHIAKIEREYDMPVSVLVNNAGIIHDSMLHKMPFQHWQDLMNVNLTSCFNMCSAVIKKMREEEYGRIINISSINALAGQIGQTNYCATKAGMIGFSKALAKENASKGITVNCVAPGYVTTDMTKNISDDIKTKILDTIPVRRFAEPQEIARAVIFLADENSSYITGHTLSVNGGQHME